MGLGDLVEIDDKAWGLGRVFGQETCDLGVHALVVHALAVHGGATFRKAAEHNRLSKRHRRCRWRTALDDRSRDEPEHRSTRPKGRAAASSQLKLLGSVTRPPRPRKRVPRRTASGQGATALIGTATISTSLSGPGAQPDCQKGRVTSLHNHHGP